MGTKPALRPWRFPKARLESFSDGVFAIVITILVLELKVPETHFLTTADVVHELQLILPKLFGWIVSFFFIALIWLHHHQIMHMSTAADYGVVWINIFLLLFIALLPFPTALMGQHPAQPLIVMIWGMTMAMVTFWLAMLYAYCTRHFLKPEYDAASVRRNVRKSFLIVPTLYLIAALCSWWSVKLSFALYVLGPLLYAVPLDREREAS
jgi:uncharacterized membrane protein